MSRNCADCCLVNLLHLVNAWIADRRYFRIEMTDWEGCRRCSLWCSDSCNVWSWSISLRTDSRSSAERNCVTSRRQCALACLLS